MRVTHVCLRYPPAAGGVEEYVQQLVERLRAAGDDVTVETTNLRTHHPPTLLEGPLHDPPYVHRHHVRTLGPLAYPVPTTLTSQLSTLNSDIIHAHGFWYAPADIAARAARRRGIPFVVNPYFAPRAKWYWRLYRNTIGRRTLTAADAVVVISPQEEAVLRAAALPLRRVELIPPGIEPAEFTRRRDNPFPRLGVPDGPVLFFAGRIARAKGIDLLLRALPEILRRVYPEQRRRAQDDSGGVHLALAGEDFGDRSEFERLARDLGVDRHATWLGVLSRDDLLAAYAHAAVFIFPSRYEAFGIAPLEAQAAGCAVVATNVSSLPFVVQDGETGLLFRPEDFRDLAAKVVTLLRDPLLRARLGAAGRVRAHRAFTWDGSVQTLRALYTDLTRR